MTALGHPCSSWRDGEGVTEQESNYFMVVLFLKNKPVQTFDYDNLGTDKTGSVQKTAVIRALIFAISLVSSNARLLGSFSPFGLALAVALPWEYCYISFAASILGYFMFGSLSENYVYIVALVIAMSIKTVLRSNRKFNNNPAALSAVTMLCLVATGGISQFTIAGTGSYSFVLKLCEGLLGGAMTFFNLTAIKAAMQKRHPAVFNLIERTSLCVIGIVILVSLADIRFLYLNLGRVCAILTVLVCMHKRGYTGGAVSGIVATLALSLFNPSLAVSACIFTVAGFIAGVFRSFGKTGQVAAFVCVNAFGVFVMDIYMLSGMLDIFTATTVFMFIPARFMDMLFINEQKSRSPIWQGGGLSSRLEFSSRTLNELQDSIENVSRKMDSIDSGDIFSVFTKAADKICRRCGFNTHCWVNSYNDTMLALNSMTKTLRMDGTITTDNIPAVLAQKCCQLEAFTGEINLNYKDFSLCENASRRIGEARMVALEQFDAMANMLMEISRDFEEIVRFDDDAVVKCKEILLNYGIDCRELCCLVDKYGRISIELYLDSGFTADYKLITSAFSKALDREFDLPSVMTAMGKTKAAFFEQANYTVEFHVSQQNEGNNRICGDTYEYFTDAKGFAHLILSDGMGSGGRAAVDSVMTCALALKLIKAGFGFDSAIKFINSSFLVKSRDESLATLDIACIDLYTGELKFMKAGAASSFILKGKNVIKVDSGSLPVGILRGVEFEKKSFSLSGGDVVVVVSDGVLASGDEWIAAELELHGSKNAGMIAESICRNAGRRRTDGHSDDITVMVAKMNKNK